MAHPLPNPREPLARLTDHVDARKVVKAEDTESRPVFRDPFLPIFYEIGQLVPDQLLRPGEASMGGARLFHMVQPVSGRRGSLAGWLLSDSSAIKSSTCINQLTMDDSGFGQLHTFLRAGLEHRTKLGE